MSRKETTCLYSEPVVKEAAATGADSPGLIVGEASGGLEVGVAVG